MPLGAKACPMTYNVKSTALMIGEMKMQSKWIETNAKELVKNQVYEAELVKAWDDTELNMFAVRFYCPALDTMLHSVSSYKNKDKQEVKNKLLGYYKIESIEESEKLSGTTWYVARLDDWDNYIYVIRQKQSDKKQFKSQNLFRKVRRDEFGCPVF